LIVRLRRGKHFSMDSHNVVFKIVIPEGFNRESIKAFKYNKS
jgi:hypothetical protein